MAVPTTKNKLINSILDFILDYIPDYIIITGLMIIFGLAIIIISAISAEIMFKNIKVETINLFTTSFFSAAVTMIALIEFRKSRKDN